MKAGFVISVVFICIIWTSKSAPPTCYSRAVNLTKYIMYMIERLQKFNRTKHCMENLPQMYLDLHNSCITTKLRDYIYMLEDHPIQVCRQLTVMKTLKNNVWTLYKIISRFCHRDLEFVSNDCRLLESGHSVLSYGEDRLKLLEEP